jgi:uncharacterized protein YcbK (DUF882 family)
MQTVKDWDRYPNFKEKEFRCSYTGRTYMDVRLMDSLQTLRSIYGKPIVISSGYRDPSHPIEAQKERGGEHTLGLAVDIPCSHQEAYELLSIALSLGFKRVGVSQKGNGRFLHLGMAEQKDGMVSPHIWSY